MDALFEPILNLLSSTVGLGSSIATGNPIGIGSSTLELGSSAIDLSTAGSSVLEAQD
ncbi:MAG: hypothetical protein ACTH2Y_08300 [Corynebacterium sp.]|uniref:hypothetical protein n=1 Tax=unclassified Corynebacterium TaxID=2624378 RepID=UPI002649D44A|nr:hypothetical protein [Corynebacterium sp.]MDN5581530.1 hypothetical protein [Corynebacterium sp.]MDN5718691.1 hypothetical protein [Corynebacterium sp.]MDN6258350.1 hypothetical protein [Corynebacterium sp.]MDN6323784.1 hypothetical protein [Corynebacterium sp.]MDN6387927.1 hypothetical protein [Corynebacterium sp.]